MKIEFDKLYCFIFLYSYLIIRKNDPQRVKSSVNVLLVPSKVRSPISNLGGCPSGVMVNAMDCGIVVSEFLLQSRYYVNIRAYTPGKGVNLFILPAMG